MLQGAGRRAPAITAVRNGLIRSDDLAAEACAAHGLAGRAELRQFVQQLVLGCESELELWGYLHVFDVPGLRHGVRQLPVEVRGRRYRLDLGYEAERVAVELDGHRFHSSRAQRERDLERDAALAAVGWITLRYSHERLHEDVFGCRRDTLAVLANRRRGGA
jgi:very-short-patch-repair endonuclease